MAWAEEQDRKKSAGTQLTDDCSSDPVVEQGLRLVADLKKNFFKKFKGKTKLRLLIQLPPQNLSPGGYSLFSNILESLNYLGIDAGPLAWKDKLVDILGEFSPNIFLASDNEIFLKNINWQVLLEYKQRSGLNIGLTASIEAYGNTSLPARLKWAKDHGIDFYYSFRNREYVLTREDYQPFFTEGYNILTIEFGANILHYYPVAGQTRDLDFIFLGSMNIEEYLKYFSPIFSGYQGFIGGMGWNDFDWVAVNLHKYLYARARIGLNIHGQGHRDWASELTERTYILAACGVPQVIDNPKMLPLIFSDDEVFNAASPKQYLEQFELALGDEKEARSRALKAQYKVLSKYTNFHRTSQFIEQLQSL